MTGGSGEDYFIFDLRGGVDHITNFTSGLDHIALTSAMVTELGGIDALSEGAFYVDAVAVAGHDADDRLIFNSTTHTLYYDADGNGETKAVKIAVLDMNGGVTPTLAYTDFIFG